MVTTNIWRLREHSVKVFANLCKILLVFPLCKMFFVTWNLRSGRREHFTIGIYFIAFCAILLGHLTQTSANVCQFEDCHRYGETLADVDTSAEPCEDFYQYACGRWLEKNPIPPNRSSWNEIQTMKMTLHQKLRDLLEEPITEEDNEIMKLAKRQYKNCMDTDYMDSRGIALLIGILDQLGGWPMTMPQEKWPSRNISWLDIHEYYDKQTGDSPIFTVFVTADDKNSSNHVIYLDQPLHEFGEAKLSAPLDVKRYNEYLDYMINIARIFANAQGTEFSEKLAESDAVDVVRFRLQLQEIMSSGVERRNFQTKYNPMTIGELQRWFDSNKVNTPKAEIDWLRVVQTVFADIEDITIDETERVIVREKDYLLKLTGVLNGTTERTLANHLHFYFVEEHLRYTTSELRSLRATALRTLSKNYEDIERFVTTTVLWEECAAMRNLRVILSKMYIKRYFPESARQTAAKVVNDIKDTLKQQISRSAWMDDFTKTAALEKLNNTVHLIGYSDFYNDDAKINRYYSEQNMTEDLLHNLLNYDKTVYKYELEILRRPYNRTNSGMYPITVNAMYSLNGNRLELPAASLQFPFFSDTAPKAILYGTTGFMAGHEMSHGFDYNGRHFDKDGNYKQWWTDYSIREYESRSVCFENQYDRYRIKELEHFGNVWADGENTLTENMADAMGILASYDTWKRKHLSSDSLKLPNLENHTDDQIFFLAYAHMWCDNTRPLILVERVLNDEHTTPRLRVNGPLSNMPSFSRAFNCKEGTPMNPPKKCTIWS